MEKQLSETQEIILNILKPVYDHLNKYGLRYYISGGTLLGAVRHKGFIPWDDDLDIALPRKDYEKFLRTIERSLPDYLKLETYRNTKKHHFYFAQIVDTRHELLRTGSTEKRKENVWIDIFPLDGAPGNAVKRYLHMAKFLHLRMMYHFSTIDKVNTERPNRPLSERIIIRFALITGFGRNTSPRRWLNRIDRLLKKYPFDSSPYAGNYMGQYKWKQLMPIECFGKGREYPFEDFKLKGPVDYDYFLKRIYGDYMKLPKDKDRNVHQAEFLK